MNATAIVTRAAQTRIKSARVTLLFSADAGARPVAAACAMNGPCRMKSNLLFCQALRVQVLQSLHIHFSALQSCDPFGGCAGGGDGGDGRDASGDRGAANSLLVKKRIGAFGGVDDQLNAVALYQ